MTKGQLFIEAVRGHMAVAMLLGIERCNFGNSMKHIEDIYYTVHPNQLPKEDNSLTDLFYKEHPNLKRPEIKHP
jgi:hypothetical protein